MKNAIVKLGFCLLFLCAGYSSFAGIPTVTISGTTPTKNTTIVFNVVFNEAVTGFTAGDVTFSGPAAAGIGAPSLGTTDASHYTITVTGVNTNGALNLNMAAGVLTSVSTGEGNGVASGTITFDNVKPNVTVEQKSGQPDPTTDNFVEYTVTFNEPVAVPLAASVFKFTGSTGGLIPSLSVNGTTGITPVGSNDDIFTVKVDIAAGATPGNIKLSINAGDVNDKAGNSNNASTSADNTIAFSGFKPSVTTNDPTGISDDRATMGGTVDDIGSSAIVANGRGVYYAKHATITTGDTQEPNNSGSTTFSEQITGLDAESHYYFRAYATNTQGTTLSSVEKDFWTLSPQPDGSSTPPTPTIQITSATSAHITFPTAASRSNAKGYVLLRRAGSMAPTTDVPDGIHPDKLDDNGLPGNSDTKMFIFDDDDFEFDDTTLQPCVRYYYSLVMFNWDETNEATTNYRYGGADLTNVTSDDRTFCSLSDISILSTPQQLDYASKTGATITSSSDGLQVFSIRLRDGAGSSDNDSRDTELASIKITIDHPEYLKKIAYIDAGTSYVQAQDPTATMTFSIPNGKTVATDNNNHDFAFYATFQTGTVIQDQLPIKFEVTEVLTRVNGNSGSDFATTTPAGKNVTHKIDVIAEEFIFTPDPLTGVSPGNDFSLTVTAVDDVSGTQHVDTNPATEVTLAQTQGGGALNSTDAGGKVQTLVNGTFTWTELQFTTATTSGGLKEIRARKTAGPIAIPDAFLSNITVKSPGVQVTHGALQELCFGTATSTNWYNLNSITLEEGEASDFGTGTDQTLSLMLPPGFVFDITAPPYITNTGTDIAAAPVPNPQYPGYTHFINENIVRIKYTVNSTGGATKDKIVITGLKVRYTSTTLVGSQPITRVGGTAQMVGNAEDESPLKSHGDLASKSSIAVSWVNTNPAPITPTQTFFSKNEAPIVLQGIKTSDNSNLNGAAAVFTGEGVAYDGTNYKFYPQNVNTGAHSVTFTYTNSSTFGSDPAGCLSSFTQNLTTYNTIITNLKTQYCIDDAGDVLGVPTSPPPSITCGIDLGILGIIQFPRYSQTAYGVDYEYRYYSIQAPYNYVPLPTLNFIPSDPLYADEIATYGYMYFAIYYKNFCTGLMEPSGVYAAIKINQKPILNFTAASTFPDGICSTDGAKLLDATPYTPDLGFDEFWVSAVGAPGTAAPGLTPGSNRNDGFYFDPHLANPSGASDVTVQINFKHQDANTCVNEKAQIVNVWAKPAIVPTTDVTVTGNSPNSVNAQFCYRDLNLGSFSTPSGNPAIIYRWTRASSPSSTDGYDYAIVTGDFVSTGGVPNIGSQGTYTVTQITHQNLANSFDGCKSDPRNLTATIMEPTVVNLDADGAVCSGFDFDLSSIHPEINSPDPLIDGVWTSENNGDFLDINGNIDNTFKNAVAYRLSDDDKNSPTRKFTLTLTSTDPSGPCGEVGLKSTITINAGVSVDFPVSPIIACVADKIAVTTDAQGAGFTWTIDPANDGGIVDIHDKVATFNPTSQQIVEGDTVKLTVTTDDPDQGGPCQIASKDVDLILQQKPLISAGSDITICTDPQHELGHGTEVTFDLHGSQTPGESSAVNYTWTMDVASTVPGAIQDPTALVTTYHPSLDSGNLDVDNPVVVETNFRRELFFTITATGPVGNVCPAESDQLKVTILGTPVNPPFTDPNPYCFGQSVALLSAGSLPSPKWYDSDDPSAVFAGSGKTFGTGLDTDTEQVANYWLTQTFDGCESDKTKITIVVNPTPVADFSLINQCFGETMEFTSNSTLSAPIPTNPVQTRRIETWEWIFNDGTQTTPGRDAIPDNAFAGTSNTFQDPHHKYAAVGKYNVTMNLVTSDGCVASKTKLQVEVGSIPVPDFTAAMFCDGDNTRFTSSSQLPTTADNTATYTWDFQDAGATSNDKNPVRQFSGIGTYNIKLHIKTLLGCEHDTTKSVSIFPFVKGNDFPYIENFESSNHGWVPEGFVSTGVNSTVVKTSWDLVTEANSITADPLPAAGQHFWATHTADAGAGRSYYENERSVLYGPCVDMTGLLRPVVAMDYFNDTKGKNDGAYIEYRIEDSDGDGEWVRLGDNGQGLDWYNDSSIGGLTAIGEVGQTIGQDGWSGQSEGWRTGRYNLNDLSSEHRVRFRVVFGSGQNSVTTEAFDGFALDYFKLESRNRLVLVENFTTNSSSSAVTQNTDAFYGFHETTSGSSEVVKIEYHTAIPAATGDPTDPIYAQNPMDPNARASFYGLSAVPRGYIDGYSDLGTNGRFDDDWAETYYNKESLKTSPISIIIDTPIITDGGIMTIAGTITAVEDELKENHYSLYIAVVERGEDGGPQFLLRKMLPSASGIKIPETAKGATFEFSETWSIDKSYLSDNPTLVAVAFVQSDIPNVDNERVVLQAAYNDNVPDIHYTTGIETPFLEQTAMYPNPADRIVNIELPQPTTTGVEVSVIDQLGRPVVKSSIGIGQRSTSISTTDLSSAVYIVQLKENGVFTTRRLLVTHSHR